MKRARGFTLIELMIVVAIIAILSSLAISIYSQSIAKSELSEAFSATDSLRDSVSAYYSENGGCPSPGIGELMTPASYSGMYIASASVSDTPPCIVTVTMRSSSVLPALAGKKVLFTPNEASNGATYWACTTTITAVYVPHTCQ